MEAFLCFFPEARSKTAGLRGGAGGVGQLGLQTQGTSCVLIALREGASHHVDGLPRCVGGINGSGLRVHRSALQERKGESYDDTMLDHTETREDFAAS